MKLIKLDEDRYLIKGSNGRIISKEEVIIQDIESNKCAKELYEGVLKDEIKSKPIKKTKQTNTTNNKSK